MGTLRSPLMAVIGAGTVGTAISVALKKKGYRFSAVISKTGDHAITLARMLGCAKASTQLRDIPAETDVLLIAVPDDALPIVARSIALLIPRRRRKLSAIHLSGVHAADVLAPLRKKGVAVAAMHPIQTFPKGSRRRGNAVPAGWYGIDGDPPARGIVERFVRDLGGRSVVIPPDLKPLYHVTCVFAAGYLSVFLQAIRSLADRLPLDTSWTEVFGPLMTTAMENAMVMPPGEALTGPIVRRDIGTLEEHLRSLAKHAPELLPLYTVFGAEVARIARGRGMIDGQCFKTILTMFRTSIRNLDTQQQPGK